MKVKAIAKGYYGGQIRSIGDVFDSPDSLSAGWFVRDVIVVAAPPDVTREQLTDGVTDSEPPALEHGEMAGHGENGAPLWKPLPEPTPEAKPENAEKMFSRKNLKKSRKLAKASGNKPCSR